MRKSNFLIESKGSAPLELSSVVVLLLVPLSPMLVLYEEIFDAIAAESIARHSIRLAVLQGESSDLELIAARFVSELSESWGKTAEFELDCGTCQKGSLLTLSVRVGNSEAIQTAGLEPR